MSLGNSWTADNWMIFSFFCTNIDYHVCTDVFSLIRKARNGQWHQSAISLGGALPLMPATRKMLKSSTSQWLSVTFSTICHMQIGRYFFLTKILCHMITNLHHEALASIFRDSMTHSYLTGLFHHNPSDRNPFWTQHTKSWKMLEAVFNVFQAPLVFSIVPMLIHKPCVWDIQEDAWKVSFPAKK